MNALQLRLNVALGLAILLLLLMPFAASAEGDLTISPLRTYLSQSARTGFVTVRNTTKERKVFAIYVESWTQDENGKDAFEDSSDLVFFPRKMDLAPGDESVVRVGVRAIPSGTEKAYRLYLDEQPKLIDDQRSGAVVQITMRFALPVFVSPTNARDALKLGEASVKNGKLSMQVENAGNRHQEVLALQLAPDGGKEADTISVPSANKYILAGASRPFEAPIPAGLCDAGAAINITAPGHRTRATQQIRLTPDMCR